MQVAQARDALDARVGPQPFELVEAVEQRLDLRQVLGERSIGHARQLVAQPVPQVDAQLRRARGVAQERRAATSFEV